MSTHSAAIESFPANTPSAEFYQIVPDGHTTKQYSAHLTHFNARLNELCTSMPACSANAFVPYPIYTPTRRVIEMQASCAIVQIAFSAIIKEWWFKPEFQSYIPLVPKIERVLRKLDSLRPYDRVGFIRPDILIPDSERQATKICEINARFIFNGFFSGAIVSEASGELGFTKGFESGMTVVSN